MFFLNSSLAATFSADGNGASAYLSGGTYSLQAFGTFGGGTFKLQRLLGDGTTYLDVSGASFTANGQATVQVPPGAYRMTLTGATGPSLKAQITNIPLS
jgi:hypothetical protein